MHYGPHPGPRQPQYSSLDGVTSGKSHNLKGFGAGAATGYWGRVVSFAAFPLVTGERSRRVDRTINRFLESTTILLPPRERRPSVHSMLRFPAILKSTLSARRLTRTLAL